MPATRWTAPTTTNTVRQPNCAPMYPPAACDSRMPLNCAVRNRASTACRRSNGNGVADPGEGQRNDGGADRTGGKSRERELAERVGESGGCRCDPRAERHDARDAVLAEAIADRPEDELEQAITDSKGGHDDGSRADGRRESGGHLRQQ